MNYEVIKNEILHDIGDQLWLLNHSEIRSPSGDQLLDLGPRVKLFELVLCVLVCSDIFLIIIIIMRVF